MANNLPSEMYLFLVAQSVREEPGGKATVLGAIPGGNIEVPKDVKFPIMISIGFLVAFRDGTGPFAGRLRVFDPDNKVVVEPSLGLIQKNQDQTAQLILNMPQFPVVKTGKFRVEIHLDGKIYEDRFSVELTQKNPPTA